MKLQPHEKVILLITANYKLHDKCTRSWIVGTDRIESRQQFPQMGGNIPNYKSNGLSGRPIVDSNNLPQNPAVVNSNNGTSLGNGTALDNGTVLR
ncbi:unnamed protein product [Rhizophagus irregularis]|nr:unnamed protein product [Rhizophagus irregularis]